MRRPRTALIAAILGAAPVVSVGIAQQLPPGPPPQTQGADSAVDAMASARSPRALLRNGLDYVEVGEFDRALPLLREAEPRKGELSAKEQKALMQGIVDAQKGIRAASNAPGRPSAKGRAGRRPGAMALAIPEQPPKAFGADPIQLTSATVETPPPALRFTPTPPPLPDSAPAPVVSPPPSTPPAAVFGVAPDRNPVPASSRLAPPDASAPTPPPEPIQDLATTPPVPAATPAPAPVVSPPPAAEEPAALPELPPSAPVPAPSPAPDASATPPPAQMRTRSASMPVDEPIRTPEPVAIPEPRYARPIPIPSASVAAPTAPVQAPTPVEAPAPAPEPTTRASVEIEAIPASAPAVPASAPAVEPAQVPAVEPPPAPAAETIPAPEPAPIAAPSPIEPAPASIPAPEPSAPPAPAGDALPPLPGSGPAAPAVAPQPRKPIASSLAPEVQREVERIAQRQESVARRDPSQQPGQPGQPGQLGQPGPGGLPSTTNPSSDDLGTDPNLSGSRLELPRAPSPTEARAIRPIPVPEEFVPLPPRQWVPTRKFWTAPATCHMPLYFQNAVLERYGQSAEQTLGPVGRFFSYPLDDPKQSKQRNYVLAPIAGAALFATQIAALPVNLVLDPPWEAEFDLGYYRPGDRIPPDMTYFPQWGVGPPFAGRRY